MSDDQTQEQPDQQAEPQRDQSAEANESAKTNVGSEHTDDESKIAEHGGRAHNERVGQEHE